MTHHRPERSRPRPAFVNQPRMGIQDRNPLSILTASMSIDSEPKVTIDCAACQRTLRFFSRKKSIRPDTQPNAYARTRSTRSLSPRVVILFIICLPHFCTTTGTLSRKSLSLLYIHMYRGPSSHFCNSNIYTWMAETCCKIDMNRGMNFIKLCVIISERCIVHCC
jgi:hypothetical protein